MGHATTSRCGSERPAPRGSNLGPRSTARAPQPGRRSPGAPGGRRRQPALAATAPGARLRGGGGCSAASPLARPLMLPLLAWRSCPSTTSPSPGSGSWRRSPTSPQCPSGTHTAGWVARCRRPSQKRHDTLPAAPCSASSCCPAPSGPCRGLQQEPCCEPPAPPLPLPQTDRADPMCLPNAHVPESLALMRDWAAQSEAW
jgi:hypothetical protein